MKLFDYQEKAVNRINEVLLTHGGLILQFDTGLGKTLTSIAAVATLSRPAVFLVPSSGIDEWCAEFTNNFSDLTKVHGAPSVWLRYESKKPTWYTIASYNCLKDGAFVSSIESAVLVIDELANFKNEDAQRTKALLAAKNTMRLGLTATIVENDLMELFTMVRMVRPSLMERQHFVNNYVVYNHYGAIAGYHNINEFRAVVKPVVYTVSRLKVAPDKVPQEVMVRLMVPLRERKLHNRKARKLLKNLRGIREHMAESELSQHVDEYLYHKFRATVNKRSALRLINSLRSELCDLEGLGKYKFRWLMRSMWKWNSISASFSGFPCVIFCDHVGVAKQLRDRLAHVLNCSVGLICGSVSMRKRSRIKKMFNSGEIPVLVCTAAGARVINLPNGRTVIHFSIPWTDAIMRQRNRITRMSTEVDEQRTYALVLGKTVDEYVYSIIRDKRRLASVLDQEDGDELQSRSQSWSEYLRSILGGNNATTRKKSVR